jgi:hypothetical protein
MADKVSMVRGSLPSAAASVLAETAGPECSQTARSHRPTCPRCGLSTGESAKTRTKLRVLLVEDNPADVELELLTLRKDGFEVAGDVTQTMNQGCTVFSQLIGFLPDREFRRCVSALSRRQPAARVFLLGSVSVHGFRTTDLSSLRDIEACLHSVEGKPYHLKFRGKVGRSTLADANESHDWRIFADFAQILIRIARPLYAHDKIGFTITGTFTVR